MKGMKNAYVCENLHITVTIDTDEGVTPMFIPCPVCSVMATSRMYHVIQDNKKIVPTHEWYTPSAEEINKMHPPSREHIEKGGLVLRKIKAKVLVPSYS